MGDPFVGTWTLDPGRSRFDVNHQLREATMEWSLHDQGGYVMTARGTNDKGEQVAERPSAIPR